MYFKQKLAYMALGCLFTIIGYTIASLSGNPVDAQSQADKSEPTVIDDIVCRKLRVVNDDGETVVAISDSSVFSGGLIVLDHPAIDRGGVWIYATSDGGIIEVHRASGEKAITMGIGNKSKDGFIQIRTENQKGSIQLSAGEYGGSMAIFNKGGENVLDAGVGVKGGGIIQTYDKHGYRTGQLP